MGKMKRWWMCWGNGRYCALILEKHDKEMGQELARSSEWDGV